MGMAASAGPNTCCTSGRLVVLVSTLPARSTRAVAYAWFSTCSLPSLTTDTAPGLDGKIGAVSVVSDGKEQVLNQAYATARVERAGNVETSTTSRPDVQQVFGPALAAMPIRPASFTVYFEEGTDELTPESGRVVAQIFSEIAR